MGYLFHLIQDRIWYQYLHNLENENYENFSNKIYSDMNICDKYILNKLNIDEKEFEKLKLDIEKLSSDKTIQQCINKSFIIRKIENKQLYFINEDKLTKYTQECIDSCEEYYKQCINQNK